MKYLITALTNLFAVTTGLSLYFAFKADFSSYAAEKNHFTVSAFALLILAIVALVLAGTISKAEEERGG